MKSGCLTSVDTFFIVSIRVVLGGCFLINSGKIRILTAEKKEVEEEKVEKSPRRMSPRRMGAKKNGQNNAISLQVAMNALVIGNVRIVLATQNVCLMNRGVVKQPKIMWEEMAWILSSVRVKKPLICKQFNDF